MNQLVTNTKTVKPAKRERATSTKGHYVSGPDLLAEFKRCKENNNTLSKEMAEYLMIIAERYSHHRWFVNFSYREDMVCSAVVNLCANWHKFDPEKSSAIFSYYTTSVYRSFLSYLDGEKTERNIRDELLIKAGANPSYNYQGRQGMTGKTSDDTAFFGSSGDD